MKEAYQPMELDIRELPQEDVITASEIAVVSDHDNAFVDFFSME